MRRFLEEAIARVSLLTVQDVPQEQRKVGEALAAQDSFINLYRVLAHRPHALAQFLGFLTALWDGELGDPLREIAVTSTVSAVDAPYPLGWHLLDGRAAGLSEGEIDALVNGANTDIAVAVE